MTNGICYKRDIQSVARLSNVFKEQFNLFFGEKMVALMVEKSHFSEFFA